MKIYDLFKTLFSDQLDKDVDVEKIKLALQFPTEDGQNLLECDSLEVGQPVSLVDADGNKTTPEDGDYEITDENGDVNVVSIKNGAIEAVQPSSADEGAQANDAEQMSKTGGDPIENHPKVIEAKTKLEAARAAAKVEAAKAELALIKKPGTQVEVDEKAKPAGTENPDEAPDKGPAPAKKQSVPKKLAKKLSTEKPGEAEPKYSKETGGAELEDKKLIGPEGKQETKASPKEATVGNKYTNTFTSATSKLSADKPKKLSAAEKLRVQMAEDKEEEIDVQLASEDEVKRLKGELAMAKEKIKILMSESKPLRVTPTTIMDKVIQSDVKLSKSDFIKKYVLERDDS